jgi:hypothetical protein
VSSPATPAFRSRRTNCSAFPAALATRVSALPLVVGRPAPTEFTPWKLPDADVM